MFDSLARSTPGGVGWRPRCDTSDFVEWDARERNAIADYAANLALDTGDWEQWLPERISCDEPTFRLSFDGALRGNGQAAGGMAIWRDGACIYRAGKQFGQLDSAFTAEVLSLEWALESFVNGFVERNG